ncbi:MAG: hypothetical protein J6S00_04345, partial [Clostridia bacterium]|nr:hypothetical protein [Clostridia bacterium]
MSNPFNNQINEMIKKGIKKQDVNNMINSLSKEDAAKLNQMLNDKKATEELLNKPEVKELMKKLFGDGKNG